MNQEQVELLERGFLCTIYLHYKLILKEYKSYVTMPSIFDIPQISNDYKKIESLKTIEENEKKKCLKLLTEILNFVNKYENNMDEWEQKKDAFFIQ
jgi:hypothetical protein